MSTFGRPSCLCHVRLSSRQQQEESELEATLWNWVSTFTAEWTQITFHLFIFYPLFPSNLMSYGSKGQKMHFNNATGPHLVFGAGNKLGFARISQ